MALDVQEIQGQWHQLKGLVQRRWTQLTDSDLRVLGENLTELVDFIEQKTGEGRESIESFLSAMTSRSASAISHAAETAREGYDRTEHAVRQHPGQSAAVAFGLGLAAGLIVGLSLRRR